MSKSKQKRQKQQKVMTMSDDENWT